MSVVVPHPRQAFGMSAYAPFSNSMSRPPPNQPQPQPQHPPPQQLYHQQWINHAQQQQQQHQQLQQQQKASAAGAASTAAAASASAAAAAARQQQLRAAEQQLALQRLQQQQIQHQQMQHQQYVQQQTLAAAKSAAVAPASLLTKSAFNANAKAALAAAAAPNSNTNTNTNSAAPLKVGGTTVVSAPPVHAPLPAAASTATATATAAAANPYAGAFGSGLLYPATAAATTAAGTSSQQLYHQPTLQASAGARIQRTHKRLNRESPPPANAGAAATTSASASAPASVSARFSMGVVNGVPDVSIHGATDTSAGGDDFDGLVERRMKRLRLSPTKDVKAVNSPPSPDGAAAAAISATGTANGDFKTSSVVGSGGAGRVLVRGTRRLTTIKSSSSHGRPSVEVEASDDIGSDGASTNGLKKHGDDDDDDDEHDAVLDTSAYKASTALILHPSAAAEAAARQQNGTYRLNVPYDSFGRARRDTPKHGSNGAGGLIVYRPQHVSLRPAYFDEDTIDDEVVFPLSPSAAARARARAIAEIDGTAGIGSGGDFDEGSNRSYWVDSDGRAVFGDGRVTIEPVDEEESNASDADGLKTTVLASSHSTRSSMNGERTTATTANANTSTLPASAKFDPTTNQPSPRAPAAPRAPYALSSLAARTTAINTATGTGTFALPTAAPPTSIQNWKTDVYAPVADATPANTPTLTFTPFGAAATNPTAAAAAAAAAATGPTFRQPQQPQPPQFQTQQYHSQYAYQPFGAAAAATAASPSPYHTMFGSQPSAAGAASLFGRPAPAANTVPPRLTMQSQLPAVGVNVHAFGNGNGAAVPSSPGESPSARQTSMNDY